MSVIRIAFLGTPDFARYHLASLLNDSHYQVVGVVTQPDRPSGRHMRLTPSSVKRLALESGLCCITPESVRSDEVLAEISSWKAEAAVVVAYGQILPQKFLDLFPEKVVNVHASLLPRWRGAAPIQRAIEAGDKMTGVSLQVMVKKLDAGDVIGSYSLPIDENMDAFQLHDALMPLGAKLLHIEFMDYLRGNLMPTPQDESLVTYARKIEKAEARLNWKDSAQQLKNHVRAMVMGPGSVCEWRDKKIKITKVMVPDGGAAAGVFQKAGEVLDVQREHFDVACGQGVLRVLEVQPESRPNMSVKDFLLGHRLMKGDVLK